MLSALSLQIIALYERLAPVRRGECCAYRATSGRAPCLLFAKRALSRYGFFKGISLVGLRITECAEAARALAASEVRFRESLMARSSFMLHHDGDTLPMGLEEAAAPVRDMRAALGTPKVRARCCGPFHWPRQYGNTDSAHGNSATGLQPSV
jgi:putative component of membrane protein insertase Oxa1/YidC/SpoIIIJ protein YidD